MQFFSFFLSQHICGFWFIKQSEVLNMWAPAQLLLYFVCTVTYGNDKLISLKHRMCDYFKW